MGSCHLGRSEFLAVMVSRLDGAIPAAISATPATTYSDAWRMGTLIA
jgi:hypothetical protein